MRRFGFSDDTTFHYVAVDNICRAFFGKDPLQHIVCRKAVAGIHKNNPFSRGQANPFIHCIVDTAVGFRHNSCEVRAESFNHLRSRVGGRSVNDDVLQILVSLAQHVCDGFLQ